MFDMVIKETYSGDAIFLNIDIGEVAEYEGNILPLKSSACLAVIYEPDDYFIYDDCDYTDEDRIEIRIGIAKSIMYGYGFYRDEENPWWLY